MAESDNKTTDNNRTPTEKNTKKTVLKVLKISGLVLLVGLLVTLIVNALLCVFVDHYYPTFGDVRFFSVVTDSMEDEIMAGEMIVGRVPKSEDEIGVDTVITYELTQGNSITLITHRVISVEHAEDGSVYYRTRGDNAPTVDAATPGFNDVVGIYTGEKCGFFGYFFGFLQSTEGAIALIIIALIVALTWIIIHFVNLVRVWRNIAVGALKKSGAILSGTQIDELGTIADVIGIVSKEPVDRTDMKRKDKKLRWFIKTGALPKRPYHDDLDDDLARLGDVDHNAVLELVRKSDAAPDATSEEERVTTVEVSNSGVLRERHEFMNYIYCYEAKLIQLKPQAKEWYSAVKNRLLSVHKMRSRMTGRYETFSYGRKAVAKIAVRGKTLCLFLALDPAKYEGTKYAVEGTGSAKLPSKYKIRSALRARYACDLIDDLAAALGAEKIADFVPKDYYVPYEGVVSLMQRGLVKRGITSTEKIYRIEEITPAEAEEIERAQAEKAEAAAVEALEQNTESAGTSAAESDGNVSLAREETITVNPEETSEADSAQAEKAETPTEATEAAATTAEERKE